jgi:hypothetical protein
MSVCEKHMMNSSDCLALDLNVEPGSVWQHRTLDVQLGSVGYPRPPFHLTPPLYLTLTTPQPGQTIDVDNVHLLDRSGYDLLSNGDFEHGRSRWYFTHDDHLVWHIKNIWVQLLFEHGLFGLLVFAVLVLYLCTRIVAHMRAGQPSAAVLGAAMVAFLVIGLTDSILDAPRPTIFVGLLFILILASTSPLRQCRTSMASRMR